MGHIVHLERELAELKRTSGADPAIASVGVTSAASLREPGAGQFNCSHELSLIVDAPDGSADWGFETVFFLHAIKLLCDARSGGQPLTLTASFVNGGMVTAKELAFLGLALPRIRDDRAARARIDIFGRTGRLAALAAAARDRRVPLLVEFGNAAADGYRVEMTFGGRYMTSRVMAAVDPAGAALRTSVERPLQPSEAAYLRRLAEAGEARRCAVRFLP